MFSLVLIQLMLHNRGVLIGNCNFRSVMPWMPQFCSVLVVFCLFDWVLFCLGFVLSSVFSVEGYQLVWVCHHLVGLVCYYLVYFFCCVMVCLHLGSAGLHLGSAGFWVYCLLEFL